MQTLHDLWKNQKELNDEGIDDIKLDMKDMVNQIKNKLKTKDKQLTLRHKL